MIENQKMIKLFKKQIFSFLFIFLISIQVLANFDEYLDELDGKNGYFMSDRTKKRLKSYYNSSEKKEIYGVKLDEKHSDFISKKEDLIGNKKYWGDWELYAKKGQKTHWPTYSKNNERAGYKYDAHHIIPQSYNGPNEWWNLFPLTNRQHHLIHSNGSVCSDLFPHSKGHGRANEAYLK